MLRRAAILSCWILALNVATQVVASEQIVRVRVNPPTIKLQGPDDRFQLLVEGELSTNDGDVIPGKPGRIVDLTHLAKFRSVDPERVQVSGEGLVSPTDDGNGTIEVAVAGRIERVKVTSTLVHQPRELHFENDILPLLSKLGCNASACHAKAEGQGGFKLSVFGFDPEADHTALTTEGRGRRAFLTIPDQSLFLKKAAGGMPHGGGVRLSKDSREYSLLRDWVGSGAPYGSANAPKLVRIELQPRERQLDMGGHQRLRVMGYYTDDRAVDVTHLARFQSNNEDIADVDPQGRVTADRVPGQVAIMASFMGEVDTFQAYVPNPTPLPTTTTWARSNFIDDFVNENLQRLNIEPSPRADDAEYMRRVYLDLIGTLPTASEARKFLADQRSDKRSQLVEQLLERPEYADYWTLRWSDLLRVDRGSLGSEGAFAYSQWIHDRIEENQPLDKFAHDLVVAEGPLAEVPEAHLYKVTKDAGEMARTVSQVFLGVRIACAQCHHHPYDRWSQTDYFGMVDFFAPVSTFNSSRGEVVLEKGNPQTFHPRTGEAVPAHALGTMIPERAPAARRATLADWMTRADNAWFSRSIANRIWGHLLGRGLVEPVDDMRATNPPTNPRLLAALADSLSKNNFDQRALIRLITASDAYQRTSKPTETNRRDDSNYSRALLKRPDAEVLFDAVCQTTGIGEKFYGLPDGYRAIQLWDSKVPHYFLKLFGRPVRETACTCERAIEPSVGQVLHLLNAPSIQAKLSHQGGRIARLTKQYSGTAQSAALVEELYLTFFSRLPTPDEQKYAVNFLNEAPAGRRAAAEDLAWSLMNSLEFVFNH